MSDDIYKTIDKMSEAQFKIKGSRFVGLLYPVTSEEEIKHILQQLKKEHYNARHHCYAYTLGHIHEAAYRINDDGEPSGTAGKPIYGQLLSYELKNVLAVVIRYFGGTKLGLSGLINAYKTTTQMTIEKANIIEKTINNIFHIRFDYPYMNEVMQALKKDFISIKRNDYEKEKCIIICEIPRTKSPEVLSQFKNMPAVKMEYIETV
ncbi:MAG: YigZ family protein [Bacteroidales bacterium]|jgi:uncharacterized YigZ family protein|nr:YigZ family protein [Bacteroidales bacterium]MDX9890374.1 YigZ family protein [Bacteroidales bacterium]NLO43155.1 YigZ family protein [Bacteroidales bacterium]